MILLSQYLDILHHPTLNKDTDFYFRALVHSFHQSFICYIYRVLYLLCVLMVRISVFLSFPAINLHVKTPILLQDSWSKTDPPSCIPNPSLLPTMTSVQLSGHQSGEESLMKLGALGSMLERGETLESLVGILDLRFLIFQVGIRISTFQVSCAD